MTYSNIYTAHVKLTLFGTQENSILFNHEMLVTFRFFLGQIWCFLIMSGFLTPNFLKKVTRGP